MLVLTGVLWCTPVLISAQSDNQSNQPSNLSIHVVQRGENLYRIALRYGTTITELATLNGILDINSLEIGQRLLVPVAGSTSEIMTHTVTDGDTPATIAERYQVELDQLLQENQLTASSTLQVGQVLILPAASATPIEATPEVEASTAEAGTANQPAFLHTVQPNETLYRIALKYNLSIQEIVLANNLADPTLIYTGQKLIIPNVAIPASITESLPAPLTGVQVDPLIFTEGETGVVEFITAQSATITGTFLSMPLNFISLEGGTRHIALVPVPVFTAAGLSSLQISLDSGASFSMDILIADGGYATQNLNVSAEMEGLLSPAVQDNELSLLRQLTATITSERYWEAPFSIPAAAAMNAGFGTRRSYNGGPVNTFHSGADFAAAPNTPIFSPASGVVVLADTLNIRGNTVVLNHGWGVYTLYAHLTTIDVQLNQTVSTGTVLGTAGSTGRVTGPHLHWELWVHGTPVNPLQWTQWQIP
jgi:murein DD-endopeptidase MepM/ murein hydrolase activator NlpD